MRKKEGIEGEGERNVWRRPKGLLEEFFARKREREARISLDRNKKQKKPKTTTGLFKNVVV